MINLNLKVNLVEMELNLNPTEPKVIEQLQTAAAKQMEEFLSQSIRRFQKDIKIDLLGFSDYFIQYHPSGWNKMKSNWDIVYPTLPIDLHVTVKIDTLGMIQSLGAK